jgi:hypothetical protein
LLLTIFDFYYTNYQAMLPDVSELIALVGKIPPRDILTKVTFFYDQELELLMNKIVTIALEEKNRNAKANDLIIKVFIKAPKEYYVSILNKMMEKGVIEPIDVDVFVDVLINYNYAAAARYHSKHKMPQDEWSLGYKFLHNLIKEKIPK